MTALKAMRTTSSAGDIVEGAFAFLSGGGSRGMCWEGRSGIDTGQALRLMSSVDVRFFRTPSAAGFARASVGAAMGTRRNRL